MQLNFFFVSWFTIDGHFEVTLIHQVFGGELDVSTLMKPWTEQIGYPVVDITIPEQGKIKATAKRFMTNPESDPNLPHSAHG